METPAGTAPEFIDLDQMPEVFESADGFTRADWTAIAKVIEESVPESDRTAARSEAAGQWVRHLRRPARRADEGDGED